MRSHRLFPSLISFYNVVYKTLSGSFVTVIMPNQFVQRSYNFGSRGCRKIGHHSFCFLTVIIVFIFVTLIVSHGHFRPYFPGEPISSSQLSAPVHSIMQGYGSNSSCDIFSGKWVYDNTYPLYNASSCPFAEHGFRCQSNGRQDRDYLKWRWQPLNCNIPRFNSFDILKRLRGLRVVFVGDSMARTQWESVICLLMQGVANKRSVHEVNGNKITKRIPFLGVRFSSFNFTIEYFRSPFLVQQGSPPKHVPKRVRSTLKLDKIDFANPKWRDADLLIFNSGHWWTPTKTFQMGCYFQVGDALKLGMKTEAAYQRAISTWASWVESKVNTSRTQVYFRSFEPTHWRGSWTNLACKVSKRPMSDIESLGRYPLSLISKDVITQMKDSITFMNVTTLSAYRSDAHVGKWSARPSIPDCSHWCLPGVPDTWNELLFASLLMKGQGIWAKDY